MSFFMYFVKRYIDTELYDKDGRLTSNYPISIQARQFKNIFGK